MEFEESVISLSRCSMILWVVLMLSMFSLPLILLREKFTLAWRKARLEVSMKTPLFTNHVRNKLIIEAIIMFIHPMPFFLNKKISFGAEDYYYYHLNDFLHVLSLIRFTYFLHQCLSLSRFGSVSAHRISEMVGHDANEAMLIKYKMKNKPFVTTFYFMVFFFFIFVQIIQIFESPIYRNDVSLKSKKGGTAGGTDNGEISSLDQSSYINSMWVLISTFCTSRLSLNCKSASVILCQ